MEIIFRWNWKCIGYGVILIIVGFFRELLGSGTLLGFKVLGDPIEKTGLYAIGYENNGFMLLAPMALIVVGIIIWVQRTRSVEDHKSHLNLKD